MSLISRKHKLLFRTKAGRGAGGGGGWRGAGEGEKALEVIYIGSCLVAHVKCMGGVILIHSRPCSKLCL